VGPLKPGWALRPGVPARSMVVAVLRIFCPGEVITIAGVREPEAAAQSILNVKNGEPPLGA